MRGLNTCVVPDEYVMPRPVIPKIVSVPEPAIVSASAPERDSKAPIDKLPEPMVGSRFVSLSKRAISALPGTTPPAQFADDVQLLFVAPPDHTMVAAGT